MNADSILRVLYPRSDQRAASHRSVSVGSVKRRCHYRCPTAMMVIVLDSGNVEFNDLWG